MSTKIFKPVVTTGFVLFNLACAASGESVDEQNNSGGTTSAGGDGGTTAASGGSGNLPGSGGSAAAVASGGSGVGGSASTGGSTSTGGANTGGSGAAVGTGGAGGSTSACGAVDMNDLVSDFEDGFAQVHEVNGRGGSWFVYNDGTVGGVQTPEKIPSTPLEATAGGACSSGFALLMTAAGFTGWGAGIGVNIMPNDELGNKQTYDATAYSGIAMRLKATTTVNVRLSVADSNTSADGGVCEDTTNTASDARCGDYFGNEVTVGTEWKDVVLPFAGMTQRGWGLPISTGVAADALYSIRAQAKGDFELWIDDLHFVK